MKLAAISVTRQGDEIGRKLKEELDLQLYSSYKNESFNFKELCKKLMLEADGIIFITSTGIAVRGIGSRLQGKDKDPAIVVVDCMGKFSISLAGGHLGGANSLALEVARILGATPVITTATDNMNITAPDVIAKENDLIIDNLHKAKKIAALLVDKESVGFWDEEEKINLPKGYVDKAEAIKGAVYITNKAELKELQPLQDIIQLKLIRKNIVLGMGCRKAVDEVKVRNFVVDTLRELNLDLRAVKAVSTVEIKKDERALLNLSQVLNCPLKIHSLDEIKSVEYKYKGSDFVKKTIGVRAVCEPCVELEGARLITEKLSFEGITLCVGVV